MKIWPALFKVFGLSFAVLSVLGFSEVGASSSSAYGPLCHFTNNARCLFGATCEGPQQCTCPAGNGVDGSFMCTNNDEQRLELTGSENTLAPWNNSLEAPFPWNCRVRFTEFTINKPDKNRQCFFQIFGENKIVDKKVLVVSMEVHIKLEENGSPTYEGAIRLTPGSFVANSYQYLESTKATFTEENPETFTEYPDGDIVGSGSGMGEFTDDEDMTDTGTGPSDDEDTEDNWSSPTPLGGPQQDGVLSKGVDKNSVAVLSVGGCGTEIRFRAGDDELIHGGLLSGIGVVIDSSVDNVQFENANSYIAGSPDEDLNKDLRENYGLSQKEILLHISMSYSAVQDDSEEGELCRDAGLVYRAYCTDTAQKAHAVKKCSNLMLDESDKTCIERHQGSNGAMRVFRQCVWADCSPTSTVCNVFRSELADIDCLEDARKEDLLSNCP